MKRVIWKPGRSLVVELPGSIYTVGQMLLEPYIQFFTLFTDDADLVRASRLEKTDRLFCVAVVNEFFKTYCEALPSKCPAVVDVPRRWLRPLMRAGVGFRGGDLIEFDPRAGRNGSEEPIIADLNAVEHRDIIDAHELTNLRGGTEFIDRLLLCSTLGYNADPLKAKVFGFSYDV